MIVYDHLEEATQVWNKRSNKIDLKELTSKYAKSSEEKNVTLSAKARMRNDFKRYFFLNFNGIFDSANINNVPYISLQTIGLIKLQNGDLKLYAIDGNDTTSMKVVFKTSKIVEDYLQFYAQVYGFCKFYETEKKVSLMHPNDCKSRPYVEMLIEHYVILPNYNEARRLEQVLSRINK